MTSLAPGQVVGERFKLVRLLGSGGMGEVWLAFDRELQEQVAVKILPDDATRDQLDLLRHECKNARKLVHESIVRVFDFHRTPTQAFITMAAVEAEGAGQWRGRPLPEILPVLSAVAEAVAYAHRQGVVHRDLKAANILIDDASKVHIVDFGIGSVLSSFEPDVGSSSSGGGTDGTASPQQRSGAAPSIADDVFGFGALARDLTSGLRLPVELDALFTACLNRDPRHRPESMEVIVRALANAPALDAPTAKPDVILSPPAKPDAVLLTPPPKVVAPPRIASQNFAAASAELPLSSTTPTPSGGIGGKTIVAFLVLLGVAASVFLVLPRWVEQASKTTPGAETAPSPGAPSDPVPSPERSVADLEALAPLKAKADALATRVNAARESLEARDVGSWGGASYQNGLSAIATAREQQGRRAFGEAATSYEAALKAFETVESSANDIVAAALSRGRRALANGSASEARDAFALALRVRPNLSEATTGLARSEVLDEIRGLVARAGALESEGDLLGAASRYRRAIELDPLSQTAQSGLARVDARASAEAFKAAMSQAVSALNRKDFEAARQSFERAEAIRPDAPDVTAGLAAVAEGQKLETIAAHRARADLFTREEAWRSAEKHYQAVLDIDPTIRFAQIGKSESRTMAELTEALEFHIGNPGRLSDESVLQEASVTVERARRIDARNQPKLAEHIARLDGLVAEFSTPVPVYLLSDNATEVVVYRVGNIGTFDRHALVLRPGTYTVVGRRPGYRDVRHRLVVQADAPPEPLLVRCEEKI